MRTNKTILLLLTFFVFCELVHGISDSNPSNNVMNEYVEIVETKKLELTFVSVDDLDNYAKRDMV